MFFVYSHLYLVIVCRLYFLRNLFLSAFLAGIHISENYIIWNKEGGKRAEKRKIVKCLETHKHHTHIVWFMWMSFNSLSLVASDNFRPAGLFFSLHPCLTATACVYGRRLWYFNFLFSWWVKLDNLKGDVITWEFTHKSIDLCTQFQPV